MNKKNGLYVTNYKPFFLLFIFTLCLSDCHASCISKQLYLDDNKKITFEGRSDTQISISTIGVSINNSKVIKRDHNDLKAVNSFLFKIIAICNPSKDAMNMFPYHIPAVGPTLICPQGNDLTVKFLILNSKHPNKYTYLAKVFFNEKAIDKNKKLVTSLSLSQKISLLGSTIWKRIKSSVGFLYLTNKIKNLKELLILDYFSISNIFHFLHHTNVKHITTCEKPSPSSNNIKN